MAKMYYDKDASLKYLKGKTVGFIGYGIQGRAQALNMRDSGINVVVANRKDRYAHKAKRDGFKVHPIDKVARISDIVMFLIPDQAQRDVYEKFLKKDMKKGAMLVFAHGYALRYKTVKLRSDIDVALLAPRMPGYHIREYYLSGSGVPVFVDMVQGATGDGMKKLLGLAKAAGFTRAGALAVGYKTETDLDLFTEQFLVAGIVKLIHTGFRMLTKEFGYDAVPAIMELYASGELAEVLKLASHMGIGRVFQNNASPTCQFGIADSFASPLGGDLENSARKIMKQIRTGAFSRRLDIEGQGGYKRVNKLWATVNNKDLMDAHRWINNSFRIKGDK
jgi:ketol-acid reductoisomerase